MKVNLLDIARERLFLKRVDLYQGKYLTAYNAHDDKYIISWDNQPLAIVEKDQITYFPPKQKRVLDIYSMIKNQFNNLKIRRVYKEVSNV